MGCGSSSLRIASSTRPGLNATPAETALARTRGTRSGGDKGLTGNNLCLACTEASWVPHTCDKPEFDEDSDEVDHDMLDLLEDATEADTKTRTLNDAESREDESCSITRSASFRPLPEPEQWQVLLGTSILGGIQPKGDGLDKSVKFRGNSLDDDTKLAISTTEEHPDKYLGYLTYDFPNSGPQVTGLITVGTKLTACGGGGGRDFDDEKLRTPSPWKVHVHRVAGLPSPVSTGSTLFKDDGEAASPKFAPLRHERDPSKLTVGTARPGRGDGVGDHMRELSLFRHVKPSDISQGEEGSAVVWEGMGGGGGVGVGGGGSEAE